MSNILRKAEVKLRIETESGGVMDVVIGCGKPNCEPWKLGNYLAPLIDAEMDKFNSAPAKDARIADLETEIKALRAKNRPAPEAKRKPGRPKKSAADAFDA